MTIRGWGGLGIGPHQAVQGRVLFKRSGRWQRYWGGNPEGLWSSPMPGSSSREPLRMSPPATIVIAGNRVAAGRSGRHRPDPSGRRGRGRGGQVGPPRTVGHACPPQLRVRRPDEHRGRGDLGSRLGQRHRWLLEAHPVISAKPPFCHPVSLSSTAAFGSKKFLFPVYSL